MDMCEGKKLYLLLDPKWLAAGALCQLIDDLGALSKYGLEDHAGKKCIIRAVEKSIDPDLYVGLVARVAFHKNGAPDLSDQDYLYWLPPECLVPIS